MELAFAACSVGWQKRKGGLRGKKKKLYYGTARIDTPEGREPINIRLGAVTEFATKTAARDKLQQIIAGMTKPDAVVPTAKAENFSDLAAEWKATEGIALGHSTMQHYSRALRAYVLPAFADRDIRTNNRKGIQDCLTNRSSSRES